MIKNDTFKNLDINLDNDKVELFKKYVEKFLQKNSQLNLISKNDEQLLIQKHIYDSLALNLAFIPKDNSKLLDIGTGGGFPSVPLAILYDKVKVYAIDSIRKKVNAVESLKIDLNLENLNLICDRIENINYKYDYVVSRAVASLDKILEYAIPHIKQGGYFVAYKSKKYQEELKAASSVIKKYNLKEPKVIKYELPLDEVYERNLLIFKL